MWGSGLSVEGEPVFQGMKVGLARMGCSSVFWVLGDHTEVIHIGADLDMWNCGLSTVISE